MKTLLVPAATLVVGIAIGMLVDGGGSGIGKTREKESVAPRSPRARQGSGTVQRPDSGGDAALGVLLEGRKPSQLSAAEAYDLFRPKDTTGEDPVESARAAYLFALLAPRLSVAVLEEVIALRLKDGPRDYRTDQLFGTYATRDWDRAMAWVKDQPEHALLKEAGLASLGLTGDAAERTNTALENARRRVVEK